MWGDDGAPPGDAGEGLPDPGATLAGIDRALAIGREWLDRFRDKEAAGHPSVTVSLAEIRAVAQALSCLEAPGNAAPDSPTAVLDAWCREGERASMPAFLTAEHRKAMAIAIRVERERFAEALAAARAIPAAREVGAGVPRSGTVSMRE